MTSRLFLPIEKLGMKNRRRTSNGVLTVNPHRRLMREPDSLVAASLSAYLRRTIVYTGNPHHKRRPGDFGLVPPAQPRLHASLCDEAGIDRKATALQLLNQGVEDLLLSQSMRNGFPTLIWSVRRTDKVVFEARLENELLGHYHGYPLGKTDPFRDEVLAVVGLFDV